MDPTEKTIMQKETVIKDDGRRLIYYRFVPETAPDDAPRGAGDVLAEGG